MKLFKADLARPFKADIGFQDISCFVFLTMTSISRAKHPVFADDKLSA
jgi:hypothetical protein